MAGAAGLGVVAIGADTGRGYFVPETQVSPLVMLVRYIRATIHATLPEVVEIPETIDITLVSPQTGQLVTPTVVMLGKAPRPGEAAVGEMLQILTYDFVYIAESVIAGVTDTQDYVRNQLVKLERAFMADYRQSGYCNDTRVQEVPIDHENQYKKIFAAEAQPVTALVLRMEFDVITRLTP